MLSETEKAILHALHDGNARTRNEITAEIDSGNRIGKNKIANSIRELREVDYVEVDSHDGHRNSYRITEAGIQQISGSTKNNTPPAGFADMSSIDLCLATQQALNEMQTRIQRHEEAAATASQPFHRAAEAAGKLDALAPLLTADLQTLFTELVEYLQEQDQGAQA